LARKGLNRLLVALVFAIAFCFLIPHVILPRLGIGAALPFIYVPGEPIPGTPITNTFLVTLITDVVLVAFAFLAVRNVKEVPGRLQSVFEMLVEFIDNLTRNIVGPKSRKVFPLAFTIFTFVLFANYLKLIPGFDSIGVMECAGPASVSTLAHPVAPNGYYANGSTLYVPSSLNSGYRVTVEDFEYCEKTNGNYRPDEHAVGAVATVQVAGTQQAVATREASVITPTTPTNGGSQSGPHSGPTAEETFRAKLTRKVDTTPGLKVSDLAAEEQALVATDKNGKLTVKQPLRELYFITPFFRGATSDLTLTLALAIITVIMIQVHGVQELGGAYWYKFVNLPALANIGNPKKPLLGLLGPLDFAVGLLEIISEISKILSFAFRLFGNIFAGQVLIFVMTFLVATGLPLIFNGLEAFVGVIQSFVFAMLYTVLAGIAMSGHHVDDEEHAEGRGGHGEIVPIEAPQG